MRGQTRLSSLLLVTSAPRASISTAKTSNARAPSATGIPSESSTRRLGIKQNRPNSAGDQPLSAIGGEDWFAGGRFGLRAFFDIWLVVGQTLRGERHEGSDAAESR